MKNLQKLYNQAKKQWLYNYYSFELFNEDCKNLIKEIKKNNIICTIKSVSGSWMSRKISFIDTKKRKLNLLINVILENKLNDDSYNFVKVSWCWMDMIFHILYSVIWKLLPNKKEKLNANCSRYTII